MILPRIHLPEASCFSSAFGRIGIITQVPLCLLLSLWSLGVSRKSQAGIRIQRLAKENTLPAWHGLKVVWRGSGLCTHTLLGWVLVLRLRMPQTRQQALGLLWSRLLLSELLLAWEVGGADTEPHFVVFALAASML